jgi:hypothetical protein
MKKKLYLTLDDDFIKYCELNNISNIEELARKVFNRGFTIEKYGEIASTPAQNSIKNDSKSVQINKTKNNDLYYE